MSATPADIAKYTNDGVVLVTDAVTGAAIKANHTNAKDTGDNEIEMFFTNAVHGQAMLNERFGLISQVAALHVGIEVEDSLGLGTLISVSPSVPCWRTVDADLNIDITTRTRAYAEDTGTDRYSVEVLQ